MWHERVICSFNVENVSWTNRYLPHLSNFPDDEAQEKFLKKYEPQQLRFRHIDKRFKVEGWLNGLEGIEQLESETLDVAAKVNLDAASLRTDLQLADISSIR